MYLCSINKSIHNIIIAIIMYFMATFLIPGTQSHQFIVLANRGAPIVTLANYQSITDSQNSFIPYRIQHIANGRRLYLLLAWFTHKHGHLAYAPTEPAEDFIKDGFYDQLSSAIQSIPPQDIVTVLGDFNALSRMVDNWCHWPIQLRMLQW